MYKYILLIKLYITNYFFDLILFICNDIISLFLFNTLQYKEDMNRSPSFEDLLPLIQHGLN